LNIGRVVCIEPFSANLESFRPVVERCVSAGNRDLRTYGASGPGCHRWFLRGFANRISLDSLFALFSALFSRIDFPVFLALLFRGDFPDNGITPF
jgi:hypothetical protein